MINTVVVDDNINSLERLRRMISQEDKLNLIADYQNPLICLNQLEENIRDLKLIILDTNIMGYSGLEIAKKILNIDDSIEVVFIASDEDYAIEAFELDAFDYLIRPVDQERFKETIERLEGF